MPTPVVPEILPKGGRAGSAGGGGVAFPTAEVPGIVSTPRGMGASGRSKSRVSGCGDFCSRGVREGLTLWPCLYSRLDLDLVFPHLKYPISYHQKEARLESLVAVVG